MLNGTSEVKMEIELLKESDGVELYRLKNSNGMTATITNYGARIVTLCPFDKNGNAVDVVAGFDTPQGFMGDNPYFNAVIGRVCNRIGGAKFTLNGKEYPLFKNDGNNHLHGGKEGFDRKLWKAYVNGENLTLEYVSSDMEEGYPSTLDVKVTYSLDDENGFNVSYEATTDGDTLCSLTNHAYFNLDGDFKTNHNHLIFIKSHQISDIDAELIPSGKNTDITGTVYDFTVPKKLGKDIKADDKYLNFGGGYDFNYILDNDGGIVASAYSSVTGINMDVYTDRPCMQFYSGNFLDGLQGKKTYGHQSAFCMETQGYPNAVNNGYPSIELKKGEKYSAKTRYVFSIK